MCWSFHRCPVALDDLDCRTSYKLDMQMQDVTDMLLGMTSLTTWVKVGAYWDSSYGISSSECVFIPSLRDLTLHIES